MFVRFLYEDRMRVRGKECKIGCDDGCTERGGTLGIAWCAGDIPCVDVLRSGVVSDRLGICTVLKQNIEKREQ